MIAGQVYRTLVEAGVPVTSVTIGTAGDRETWVVHYDPAATAAQRATGETIRSTFDPQSPAVRDADLAASAQAEQRTAVLATCALIAKTTDPAGWAALTGPQRVARVQALAAEWRTFYLFAAKNL